MDSEEVRLQKAAAGPRESNPSWTAQRCFVKGVEQDAATLEKVRTEMALA
jgi:hypothetical protein